jgi:hypothetical protein
MTNKELCCRCGKNLYNKTAWSCDSEPCILIGSEWGLLCCNCAEFHAIHYKNHEVTKIK